MNKKLQEHKKEISAVKLNNTASVSHNKGKGAVNMKNKKTELELEKQTLEAWARLLCKEGMIDLARCTRMIERIEKMTA